MNMKTKEAKDSTDYRLDLNGDGKFDIVEKVPRHCEINVLSGECMNDAYILIPKLCTPHNNLSPLKRAPSGIVRLMGEYDSYAYDGRDQSIRFFQENGVVSFVNGQRAGILDRNGKIVGTMKIDGMIVGLRVETKLGQARPHLKKDSHGNIHRSAYELDKNGKTHEYFFSDLTWLVNIGGKEQRLDLSRLLAPQIKDKELTEAERCLRPLFEGVKRIRATDKDARSKIKKLMTEWKNTGGKKDRPAKISISRDPVLWSGIHFALERVAGIS